VRLRFAAAAFAASVVAGLAAVPAGTALTVPPRNPSPIHHCAASQLKLQLVGEQGATGHRLWSFAWRNNGSACNLRGYPKVVFLNKQGKPDTGKVSHATSFPVKTITVKHGKRAYLLFEYLGGGFCSEARKALRFEFTPPGDRVAAKFNPTATNHGVVAFCRGSVTVYPVYSEPTP
jgi:Domain of unknown function (DUF4232)